MASMAKTGFLLMLLLTAVVATQAHKCKCKNSTPTILVVAGVTIDVNVEVILDINISIDILLHDILGKLVKGTCYVPSDVTALNIKYNELEEVVEVVVTEVDSLLGGLLTLIGSLLSKILVKL